MDEHHHEDTMASVQLHVYMCIDEMKRLVNRRVVLYLLGSRPPVMCSLVDNVGPIRYNAGHPHPHAGSNDLVANTAKSNWRVREVVCVVGGRAAYWARPGDAVAPGGQDARTICLLRSHIPTFAAIDSRPQIIGATVHVPSQWYASKGLAIVERAYYYIRLRIGNSCFHICTHLVA